MPKITIKIHRHSHQLYTKWFKPMCIIPRSQGKFEKFVHCKVSHPSCDQSCMCYILKQLLKYINLVNVCVISDVRNTTTYQALAHLLQTRKILSAAECRSARELLEESGSVGSRAPSLATGDLVILTLTALQTPDTLVSIDSVYRTHFYAAESRAIS